MTESEIISIEEIGEMDTIDVNISNNRLFLANGILTHNSAVDAKEINQSHVAGGISKVNTVDIYASILSTPTMKAAGEIGFSFLKTRNSDGTGKTIYLDWNNKQLRITDSLSTLQTDTTIADKISQHKLNINNKKQTLLDIMNFDTD